MSAPEACDACLRHAWLVGRLASHLEIARHERRRLREILALDDHALLEALAGDRREELTAWREALAPEDLRSAVVQAELEALCRHSPRYPHRLLDLDDPPAALFVAGGVERLIALAGGDLEEGPRAVAVVGTRQASPDGLEVGRALGRGLAATGITVVSGMALGIDSAAHAGALERSGPTLAVLAGGADVPYPRRMATLHRQLMARHCVVSELPPGFRAFRWCFPARNRIIAALSHMTVVVEAAERSGSLITAEMAADLGRAVGAVPGPVTDARSRGANALLHDGALVVRDARDVLDAVVGVGRGPAGPAPVSAGLRAVLEAVEHGRDTLAALAGGPGGAPAALAALTELELLGRVRRAPGGRYVAVPS